MVPIPEVCRVSGLGRSLVYECIASGELASVKVGGRRLVHVDDLRAFVNRLRGVNGDRVGHLVSLVDADGRIDVARIPRDTSLAELAEVKRIVTMRRGVPDEAA